MYFCLPKTVWSSNAPAKIVTKAGLTGSNTWAAVVATGKFGLGAYSYNWGDDTANDNAKYCIIKGDFSMKEGELSALSSLGSGLAYPNFTVMTKSEANTLVNSSTFTGE